MGLQMMSFSIIVERFAENPIITPADVHLSREDSEVIGAFNPGVAVFGDETLLLLRFAERPKNKAADEQIAPVLNPVTGLIEHIRMKNDDPRITGIPDSRSFCIDGDTFLTSISHLRLARSKDRVHFAAVADSGPVTIYYGASDESTAAAVTTIEKVLNTTY